MHLEIRAAYDGAVAFFDTARSLWSLRERDSVGEALLGPIRNKVVIATKFGFEGGKVDLGLKSKPKQIRESDYRC